MNKETIKNMKEYFNECIIKDTVYEEDLTLYYMQIAKEYINYLEQKETILDKVTEECRKQMTTYEDSILEIFPGNLLNIIEGEENGTI